MVKTEPDLFIILDRIADLKEDFDESGDFADAEKITDANDEYEQEDKKFQMHQLYALKATGNEGALAMVTYGKSNPTQKRVFYLTAPHREGIFVMPDTLPNLNREFTKWNKSKPIPQTLDRVLDTYAEWDTDEDAWKEVTDEGKFLTITPIESNAN
jgi:hypothetical protein